MKLLTKLLLICSLCIATNSVVNATIYVSIKPLAFILHDLAKDVDDVSYVIPENQSPHTYRLTIKDFNNLSKAEAIFYFDEDLEISFNKSVDKIKSHSKKIKVIEISNYKNLKPYIIKTVHNHNHGSHDHDNDHNHDHDHHHGHHDLESNYHIWPDYNIMSIVASDISKTLEKIYPNKVKQIKSNLSNFNNSLSNIDIDISDKLEGTSNKAYLTQHDALVYFEKEFNLKNVGYITINPNLSTSLNELDDLYKKIKSENVVCIFKEPQIDSKVIDLLHKKFPNVKISTIDPIGINIQVEDGSYVKYIKSLATSYESCLK